MEVKSDLSKVRVGDVVQSLRHGAVEVVEVSETHILGYGQLSHSFNFCIAKWRKDGKINSCDVTPDLYWPGVQIIPAEPPKRMKKVTVEKWVALYRQYGSGGLMPYVRNSLDEFPYPERMVGEPQRVIWQIEVEDV